LRVVEEALADYIIARQSLNNEASREWDHGRGVHKALKDRDLEGYGSRAECCGADAAYSNFVALGLVVGWRCQIARRYCPIDLAHRLGTRWHHSLRRKRDS